METSSDMFEPERVTVAWKVWSLPLSQVGALTSTLTGPSLA